MDRPSSRRTVAGSLGALLLLLFLLPACSDDPVLGPSDGTPSEGGSYSALDRLAPPARAADSSANASGSSANPSSLPTNPERF